MLKINGLFFVAKKVLLIFASFAQHPYLLWPVLMRIAQQR